MKEINKLIEETFEKRYTAKSFDKNEKISDEDFNTILKVINLSPSSLGLEPWKVIDLKNEEIKKELYESAWGARHSLDGADHVLLILSRTARDVKYNSDYVKHIVNDIQKLPENVAKKKIEKTKDFQENDFNLKTDNDYLAWASKQTYIVLANILTAAALLNIDSAAIEGFNINKVSEILEKHNVYDKTHFKISLMVGLGYCKTGPKHSKTRQKLEDIFETK